MRIGLDWRPTFGGRGGIPIYVRGLAASLAARRPEDALLLYGHQVRGGIGRLRARAAPPPRGARLHAAPIPSRAADALARFGVGADVLLGGCDVFHTTDYAFLRPSRAAFVATIHDVLFEELPRCYTPQMRTGLRRVTRRLVRWADRLVVPSVRTKSALVERFGADADRVDVVALAPRPLPCREPARFERPTFLAVGTLEPRKNLARVLAAFRLARTRGLEADLVVVGARGWLDDAILAAAAACEGVRVEGAVDDARLAALYAGATALVYPSLGEGFGLPVVEAMAASLPVVTSAATTCADVAGEAALLVDPYDVEAVAVALTRLARDAALRDDLAARGRARAAGFRWETTADGTRGVLRAGDPRPIVSVPSRCIGLDVTPLRGPPCGVAAHGRGLARGARGRAGCAVGSFASTGPSRCALARAARAAGIGVFLSPWQAFPRLAVPVVVTVHELPFVRSGPIEGRLRAAIHRHWLAPRRARGGGHRRAVRRRRAPTSSRSTPSRSARVHVVPHAFDPRPWRAARDAARAAPASADRPVRRRRRGLEPTQGARRARSTRCARAGSVRWIVVGEPPRRARAPAARRGRRGAPRPRRRRASSRSSRARSRARPPARLRGLRLPSARGDGGRRAGRRDARRIRCPRSPATRRSSSPPGDAGALARTPCGACSTTARCAHR